MTYYEKLVRQATAAMNRHPKSTVILDADNLKVLAKSADPAKAAEAARSAADRGQTPVIVAEVGAEETTSVPGASKNVAASVPP